VQTQQAQQAQVVQQQMLAHSQQTDDQDDAEEPDNSRTEWVMDYPQGHYQEQNDIQYRRSKKSFNGGAQVKKPGFSPPGSSSAQVAQQGYPPQVSRPFPPKVVNQAPVGQSNIPQHMQTQTAIMPNAQQPMAPYAFPPAPAPSGFSPQFYPTPYGYGYPPAPSFPYGAYPAPTTFSAYSYRNPEMEYPTTSPSGSYDFGLKYNPQYTDYNQGSFYVPSMPMPDMQGMQQPVVAQQQVTKPILDPKGKQTLPDKPHTKRPGPGPTQQQPVYNPQQHAGRPQYYDDSQQSQPSMPYGYNMYPPPHQQPYEHHHQGYPYMPNQLPIHQAQGPGPQQ